MSEKKLIFFLFLVILVGMVSMFYFKNYKSYVEEKEELIASIEKIKDEIKRAKNIDREIAEARKHLNKVKQKMEELNRKIQTEINIPIILNKIEEFAKATTVDFKEIKFENIAEREGYSILPVTIQAIGEYHALGRFMSRLENFRYITARRNSRLSLISAGSSGNTPNFSTFRGLGFQGVGVVRGKTNITMTLRFNIYKFSTIEYAGAEDIL